MKYDIREYTAYHKEKIGREKKDIRNKCSEMKKLIPEIKKLLVKNGARKIVVFGSFIEKRLSINSDLDIAEEGIPDHLFFKVYSELCDVCGKVKVDLIDIGETQGIFRTKILGGEMIYNVHE